MEVSFDPIPFALGRDCRFRPLGPELGFAHVQLSAQPPILSSKPGYEITIGVARKRKLRPPIQNSPHIWPPYRGELGGARLLVAVSWSRRELSLQLPSRILGLRTNRG